MWFEDFLRTQLKRLLAQESHVALESRVPLLESRFRDIDEFGLYLLKVLHRPYTVEQVRAAVGRALGKGFKCVNVDTIFALPDQTYSEVQQAGHLLAKIRRQAVGNLTARTLARKSCFVALKYVFKLYLV